LYVINTGVTCEATRNQEMQMPETLTILGLESSCDDTAAAIIRHTPGENAQILSSVVFGQELLHADFGGVVPEIAARAHAEKLDHCVEDALSQADLTLKDMNAIAVTAGPGLIGGVLSGVMCAKGLSAGAGIPLIGVNHLAGHALTPRMTDQLPFPYLALLVSGGHCQFLIVHGFNDFTRLGGTIDDAPGEAFDKSARLLGLRQPGGPAIEIAAINADATRFPLPRPLLDRPGCDMSFSGLKTALRRTRDNLIAEQGGLKKQDVADLAAGFQAAICDVLVEKSRRAMREFTSICPTARPSLAVVGGVAANKAIRENLTILCQEAGFQFLAPPLKYCTDNAAMIAWVGIEKFRAGNFSDMTLTARPRWPLDETSQPMLGSGKKGAKA
jgi:N6-L-threonylcarbamoyladenine synthase